MTSYESPLDIYANFSNYINNKYSSFGIYSRVSTESQDSDENGNISLNTQETNITGNLNKHNVKHYNTYSEVCSAYKNGIDSMHELKKCINLLRRVSRSTLKPGLLIIHDISRLTRNINTFSIINTMYCVPGYIEIYSCIDNKWFNNKDFPFDNNEFWSKVGLSYNYSVELSEKQKKSIKYRRNRGDVFGKAPYGFESYREHGGIRKFRKNHSEEKIIKSILNHVNYKDVDDIVYNDNYLFRGKQLTYNTIKTLERKYGNKQKKINLKELEKELSYISTSISQPLRRSNRNSRSGSEINNDRTMVIDDVNMSDFRRENNPFIKRKNR